MATLTAASVVIGSAQQQPAPPAGAGRGDGRGRGAFVPIGVPVAPFGNGPWTVDTAEQHGIKITVVTKGLSHPWSLAFLPDRKKTRARC
jgi:glucose/arabinose dehydrogenase